MTKRHNRSIGPRIFRVPDDIPGMASAGAFVWYDPTTLRSVRVISFPVGMGPLIPSMIETGLLEECKDFIIPQLKHIAEDPVSKRSSSHGFAQIRLVK